MYAFLTFQKKTEVKKLKNQNNSYILCSISVDFEKKKKKSGQKNRHNYFSNFHIYLLF